MSFTGDLEHLPIVDVVQLLNSTRKSGVLNIRGRKGESQLVFKEGFIVSASHLNRSVRIGQVLIERGAIRQEDLDRALEEQSQAGHGRAPLIVTLLELDLVNEKEAYAGLQSLIELTIVEVLTWKKGTFILEPSLDKTPDSYQYYPDHLNREINVDTQGVLMDALRIFDEKIRDGELSLEEEEDEEADITEDDLGLADLDRLERRIPGVFTSLDDRSPAGAETPFSPTANNLVRRLNELIAGLTAVSRAPEVALAQLRYVSEIFPRALTLVMRGGELIAEKGIGIGSGEREVSPPLGYRLPLPGESLLKQVVDHGSPYWGPADDPVLKTHLFSRLGSPAASNVLLLPARAHGRTVFLTLADFGAGEPGDVPVGLLEMLSGESGRALDRILGKVKG